MKTGDMIRVQDWPDTNGERYKVKEVRGEVVDAWKITSKGMGYALRSFPVALCHVDRGRTRSEADREEEAS